MTHPVSQGRRTLPAGRSVRPGVRRLLALPVLGLLAALVLMLAPALASADSASTLSIVGTSDVSDSGLIPNLIQPQFQAAFPQFTFKYTGSATGTAIQNAESGTGGPRHVLLPPPVSGEPVRLRRVLDEQQLRARDLHQRLHPGGPDRRPGGSQPRRAQHRRRAGPPGPRGRGGGG